MAKDTSYELFKGVVVTDADTIAYNKGERLDTSKYSQFDRNLNKLSMMDQAVRDRLGKNNGWYICKSWSDIDNKTMNFQIMANARDSKIVVVDYETICKEFNWKSFKWSEDGLTVIPMV